MMATLFSNLQNSHAFLNDFANSSSSFEIAFWKLVEQNWTQAFLEIVLIQILYKLLNHK